MTIKYLATVDDVNACDCCGKTGLKKTVAIDFDGDVRYYGVICAGKALGHKTKNAADVKAAVNKVNEFEKIKYEVLSRRVSGENVVYGRFYVGRSHKTKMMIAKPSEDMLRQVFPEAT